MQIEDNLPNYALPRVVRKRYGAGTRRPGSLTVPFGIVVDSDEGEVVGDKIGSIDRCVAAGGMPKSGIGYFVGVICS